MLIICEHHLGARININKQARGRFDQSTSCPIPNKAVSIPAYSLYDDQDTSPSCILIHMVSSQRNGHPMPIAVVASPLVAIVDNNSQAYDTQIVHQSGHTKYSVCR